MSDIQVRRSNSSFVLYNCFSFTFIYKHIYKLVHGILDYDIKMSITAELVLIITCGSMAAIDKSECKDETLKNTVPVISNIVLVR